MFKQLNLSSSTPATIEWEMTPDLAFCTYSAKGLREDLNRQDERVCYFFIDNYGDEPKLYLMERGSRFINILAEILAPLAMMQASITNHGSSLSCKDNFPVDSTLRKWLLREVVQCEESKYLIPSLPEDLEKEDFGDPLPSLKKRTATRNKQLLPAEQVSLTEEQLEECINSFNFFDTHLRPQGEFPNNLADSDDMLSIVDCTTDLMWQRGGLDLCSIRKMNREIEALNTKGFAGYHDWRMPSLEEAMSLMEPLPNTKGIHLHPCFSKEIPFIFVTAKRSPTGYWFVDYKQGRVYWSSGTVPGGFCRLCRSIIPA